VFFVYEDQAKIRRRRKDGGTRADDDGRFAALDSTPLLAAFLRRER